MIKLNKKEKEEFYLLAGEMLEDERYRRLLNFIQHGKITTYEHSRRVALMAFWMKRRFHLEMDEKELITACLLHDYYLYDWHTYGDHLHGLNHPHRAVERAREDFLISERVASAIESHMWPLTLRKFPRNRTAWMLTISDKVCSLQETVLER